MTKPIYMILVIVAVSLSTFSLADKIYRTVDESGQVIFTDSPPTDASKVERLELPPGPSARSIRATESRNRAIRQSLEAVENQRVQQTKSRNRRIKQAEKTLAEAESQLTEAKKLKDEDRQKLAGGKRRIRPEYFERVRTAEEAVEAAKKRLKKARSTR